jgi:mannose-6-phosphate isomerase-like protein (cupin superfamily)
VSGVFGPFDLDGTFIRLAGDQRAEPLPVGTDFWQRLATGSLGSFHGEYLITSHAYEADWRHWEMHPNGDEIVCLMSGSLEFALEVDAAVRHVELGRTGEFLIVPRGSWHTANVPVAARLLFITAGEGTRHRDR